MKRDFKTWVILLAFSIPLAPMLFLLVIYFINCGATNNCARGNLAEVIHTPIPTLLPATLSAPAAIGPTVSPATSPCAAPANTLLAAWVGAGSEQSQSFVYTDLGGGNCAATFADIQPLFSDSNLWYPGALACTTCHNASLEASAAGLDLSSYAGILAGSRRSSVNARGTDILGKGIWSASLLNQVIFVTKAMPSGAPSGALTNSGPVIQAGEIASTSVTPTPPLIEEVPEPSNPGGPGQAVDLKGDAAAGALIFSANCSSCHGQDGQGGIENPGSTDGTVPPINPIDPLLKDADLKTYATNIDLFIQNGSVPEGPSPFRNMPGWGNQDALTQQQIADVIAYIISLNK